MTRKKIGKNKKQQNVGTKHPYAGKKKVNHEFIIVCLIIAVAIIAIASYHTKGNKIYAEGSQREAKYSIITMGDGPSIYEATVNPFQPKSGEKVELKVKIKNAKIINSVSIEVKTDNTAKIHDAKLLQGTATDGTWTASWKMEDTYLNNYVVTIKAISENKESKVDLTLK